MVLKIFCCGNEVTKVEIRRTTKKLAVDDISLFGFQCLHRVEARCTPSRNDTCERGHHEQRCGNCGKNRGIERLNLIEQVARQPAHCQASCESGNKTEYRGPHSIQQTSSASRLRVLRPARCGCRFRSSAGLRRILPSICIGGRHSTITCQHVNECSRRPDVRSRTRCGANRSSAVAGIDQRKSQELREGLPSCVPVHVPTRRAKAKGRFLSRDLALSIPTFQRSGSGSRSQRLLPRNHSAPTN